MSKVADDLIELRRQTIDCMLNRDIKGVERFLDKLKAHRHQNKDEIELLETIHRTLGQLSEKEATQITLVLSQLKNKP